MKKLYRLNNDRKLFGVSSGLGEYFDVDPVLFRVLFIILSFLSGLGLLIYLVLWGLVPAKSDPSEDPKSKRLYLSTTDKKLAGVCGGLGEFFDVDPVFFRVFFVLGTVVGGLGLIVYVTMWLIVPQNNRTNLTHNPS